MRPPISEVSPQLQFLATIATIKPGCAHQSGASAIASKAAAHARSHLPSQPNPHSRARGPFRVPSPAGSFLGGFRTPAAGGCLTVFAGRHPKPCTNSEKLTVSIRCPLRPEADIARLPQPQQWQSRDCVIGDLLAAEEASFFHACSRTTSSAFLSVRSPTKAGCRISPSLVHSVNFISPTSLGVSHVVAFSCFTFWSKGFLYLLTKLSCVTCSTSPNSLIIASRIANFCTFPVTVMGKSSTNRM